MQPIKPGEFLQAWLCVNIRLRLLQQAEGWFSFLHHPSLCFATEEIPSHQNSQLEKKIITNFTSI